MGLLEHNALLSLFESTKGVLGVGYTGSMRESLFQGVPTGWVAQLPILGAPQSQLFSDMARMNDTPTLADGVVPLRRWLANVIVLSPHSPRVHEIRSALAEITGDVNGAPVVHSSPVDDQLRTEAMIGRDETLEVGFLARGSTAAKGVAKLVVPRYDNGAALVLSTGEPHVGLGTGWLAAPGLLFTCYHVIRARRRHEPEPSEGDLRLQVKHTEVLFDFDAEGAPPVVCQVFDLVAVSKQLDVALLELIATDHRLGPRYREAPLPASADTPFPVNIIQHPGGRAKRIAIRNNLLYSVSQTHLRYRTDTDEGSSGAPVFDDTWSVIGMHQAARLDRGPDALLPVVNQGLAWASIRAWLNHDHPGVLAPDTPS